MFKTRVLEVSAKVNDLFKLAKDLYGVDLSRTTIRFDLKGRTAGMACWRGSALSLRFNTTMMNESWDHIINDTVPHEVAHLVCFERRDLGSNHDQGWKTICRQLGGSGATRHNEKVIYANGKTWAYTTSTGEITHFSDTYHRKVQMGYVYRMKKGGVVDKTCAYELVGVSGRPVAPTAPIVAAPTNVVQLKPRKPVAVVALPAMRKAASTSGNGKSKADQVRDQIAVAKADGQTMDQVIAWAMIEFTWKKALATVYVSKNW